MIGHTLATDPRPWTHIWVHKTKWSVRSTDSNWGILAFSRVGFQSWCHVWLDAWASSHMAHKYLSFLIGQLNFMMIKYALFMEVLLSRCLGTCWPKVQKKECNKLYSPRKQMAFHPPIVCAVAHVFAISENDCKIRKYNSKGIKEVFYWLIQWDLGSWT